MGLPMERVHSQLHSEWSSGAKGMETFTFTAIITCMILAQIF